MTRRDRAQDPERTSIDEWGMYDAERTGLAALRALVEARHKSKTDERLFGVARILDIAPAADERRPTKTPHDW